MTRNSNRTVIITGGNKGIGASIAKVFYGHGYNVVVGARSIAGPISRLGRRVFFNRIDVREESGHKKLVEAAIELTGRLDVYINCAGLSIWRPVKDIDEEFLNTLIDTNLKGVLWGCKAAAAVLKKGGSIINISSLAGKRGSANNSVYCATKFGVNGITQSLAKELGPRGIRVNAVCPVYIQTPGLLEALSDKLSPAAGKDVSAYIKDFSAGSSALGRMPEAKEVADVCLFLASDGSSAITGQCINVDCGVMPQ
jgi:3-oxoacyl-[acyl-carrier protein] reductase/meso-butanediol dehydrogenase/(S,S)-butanediol dehydrogenase/diacetyl reductase